MPYRSTIAIDPGKRSGFAIFHERTLIAAGCRTEADMLREPPTFGLGPSIAVIERPVIYPVGVNETDPEDLLVLGIFVGDLRGFYRRAGLDVALVKPRTWKGTVPKAIHNKRVLGALSPEETAKLSPRPRAGGFDHNMVDAIGLGLWQLERIGP